MKRQNIEMQSMYELNQKQQASIVAASKMSELGKMAGGIAHEINTPLSTIQMSAEILIDFAEKRGLADFVSILQRIYNTSNRIANIVSGLRTFSREGSRDPFRMTDISKLIEGTVSLCSEKFKLNSIDLRVHSIEGLMVTCRETQLSQVLLNLLNNSFDAIVDLNEKWVEVQVFDLGNDVQVSVTDSGGGISPDVQEKLFNPFFTTKDIGSGTGLGLSISLGIINDHKGRIDVDNTCKNTRFVVILPKDLLKQMNEVA